METYCDKHSDEVPRIITSGRTVYSEAKLPQHISDTCSCWPDGEMKKARKLLVTKGEIVCKDATAYAAMLALSISLLSAMDIDVRGKLVKEWESTDD